ncbi:Ni/Fe hydrogenase subunit alpha [Magnetospira sp. QH-2]|uniref:Ni/Fe hydrogenase subunit alpha n=1 Tax=Magnetospira sp. (strain QH-2) TaxID=1288970 RepID=UPI0003E81436|nr:Ni/Fe hydrogenase subunit alpha [Magnetospira sp. QH-2]CCQ74985.1 putative nickel-dependent hydrogenase, large subunit [Magnetospira sp. QH-2]
MSSSTQTRTIKVNALARVEGEGALNIRVKNGEIKDLQFRIYEPPRFFEALLRGRMYTEAPDITARICGICPMAYMMGASQAMEDALGVTVTGPLRDLRRIIYCAEWIESHVLHAAMLHAPDFLGLDDALLIAKANPELVGNALQLKKLGNDLLEAIGGRAVHPVNLKVGGFYKAPTPQDLAPLKDRLKWGMEASETIGRAFAGFDFPDLTMDYDSVSMTHPDEYAICEGGIMSSSGTYLDLNEFLDHYTEEHVAHSNALHGVGPNGRYLVGPWARYNNNGKQLSKRAKALAKDCGLGKRVTNPYRSILVRMVETLYACEESLRLIEGYEMPDESCVQITPGAGTGYGCTEAPRGICFHSYSLDKEGRITKATIVPPTAQNQKQIEEDLRVVVQENLDLDNEALTWRCEQTIRNYDPCISCATHFLDLTVTHE